MTDLINCLIIKGRNTLMKSPIFWISFAYLDSNNNLADSLFSKHGVRLRLGPDFVIRGNPNYKIVFCRVHRKDIEKFYAALDDLTDKMHICGHPEYEEFCRKTMTELYGHVGLDPRDRTSSPAKA